MKTWSLALLLSLGACSFTSTVTPTPLGQLLMPAVVLVAIQLLTGPLGLAPCYVRLRVRVEPKTENRSVTVTLNSPDFYRLSEQPLEGDQAAATQPEQEYKDLPAGEYEIRATVSRVGLRDLNTRAQFLCAGPV